MEILLAKILFDVLRLPNEGAQNRTRKRPQKLANLKAENKMKNLTKINKVFISRRSVICKNYCRNSRNSPFKLSLRHKYLLTHLLDQMTIKKSFCAANKIFL
jgi:hypothetical protein